MGKGASNKVRNVDLARHKQMLEEKARKEREEMKRQLLLGLEFSSGGQKDDMRIFLAQQKGTWATIVLRINLFIEAITPLNK
jgi:hypothetical protein